jgi:hypothetical protein
MRISILLATLCISGRMFAQPANDDCAGAITITPQAFGSTCTSPIAATTLNATPSAPAPTCGATAADDDIWYSFTTASQSVIVRITGAALIPSGTASVSFEIYSGACGSLVPVECNNGFAVINGYKIVNGLTSGNVYFIRFWSTSTVSDMTFNFCVQTIPAPPANDECAGAIAITTQPFGTACTASVSANTTGSTHSTPDPSCGVSDSNDDIWYSFTANSQSIILRYSNGLNTVTGSTTQGLGYALYNAACPVTTATISCSSAISVTSTGHQIIDGLTIGNTYYLRLFSDNANNYMSFDFCVQDVPPPPANNECVNAQPISLTLPGTTCVSTYTVHTAGATQSAPNPNCTSSANNDDLWYSFTASAATAILRYSGGGLTSTAGAMSLGFAVYSTSCPVTTTTVVCNSGFGANSGFFNITGLTAGTNYYLRLFTGGGNLAGWRHSSRARSCGKRPRAGPGFGQRLRRGPLRPARRD